MPHRDEHLLDGEIGPQIPPRRVVGEFGAQQRDDALTGGVEASIGAVGRIEDGDERHRIDQLRHNRRHDGFRGDIRAGGELLQIRHIVLEDRDDDRFAVREMPVQAALAHSRTRGDQPQRGVGAVFGEHLTCRGQQRRPVLGGRGPTAVDTHRHTSFSTAGVSSMRITVASRISAAIMP
ncbi:hypothetical protein B7C42_05402 [Nocardia cerradoensis]|uniref:Uncharacterized protein n=1 Tax=Nocardia cerradoensis TaxID=85688 RepID=A0A231H193_9NOCA|nr:hypothetical protein B7C42_05402 [Nocardia cerradoensis]